MYVEKPETAKKFVSTLKRRSTLLSKIDLVIAPPFTLVPVVSQLLGKNKSIRLGCQSISPFTEAQHTGDISSAMLKAFGVSVVMVGHSERRAAGDNDAVVTAQIRAAHATNLTIVLCVGETERDAQGSHFSIIEQQLQSALRDKTGGKLIVAYEPVWAIGKGAGDAMQAADVEEMVIFIRKTVVDVIGRAQALKVPILYGGSVEDSNAAELLHEGGVSGFLVGHASADIDSFINILIACL